MLPCFFLLRLDEIAGNFDELSPAFDSLSFPLLEILVGGHQILDARETLQLVKLQRGERMRIVPVEQLSQVGDFSADKLR